MANHELYVVQGKTLDNIAGTMRAVLGVDKDAPIRFDEVANSEKTEQINADVEAQADIIAQIKTVLEGKAAGGSDLPDWDDDSPIVASGQGINSNNAWEITEKGTLRWLVIVDNAVNTAGFDSVGVGSIVNYSNDFAKNAYKVKQAYVADGFESVGLVGLPNCERIRLPVGIEKVSTTKLGLKEIDFSGINTLRDNQCDGLLVLEKVVLNPLWTTLKPYSFRSCIALRDINLENITVFGTYCMYETMTLDSVVFNENLISIGTQAFGASSLTKVFFQNSTDNLPTIASNAFAGCMQLKDVFVPWALGEVDNAPWGATNATIHYNTTYDANGNPECPCHPSTEV